jgi:ferric iron reductase protein FhuF
MVVMMIIALLVVKEMGAVIEWTLAQKENFKAVILILSLGGIPASYFFHTKKIKHLNQELSFDEKLMQYKSSFFIKIVTLEALAVLGLIGYMLTADNTFIYVFALLFLAYLINRPTLHSISNEIEPENFDENDNSE